MLDKYEISSIAGAIEEKTIHLLECAKKERDKIRAPVYWNRLHVSDVVYCLRKDGSEEFRVEISPGCPEYGELHQYLENHLRNIFDNIDIVVAMEW